MSQDNQNRTRSSHQLLYGEPARIHPGPPSPVRPAAAHTAATHGPSIPVVRVTPPLSIYRPVSEVYPGPPSVMQAAWGNAPEGDSFLDSINITEVICDTAYDDPANFGPQPAPMAMPPATIAQPGWPATIIVPRPQQAVPVCGPLPAIAAGPVIQPVAPTAQHAVTLLRPKPAIATGAVAQLVGQTVPSRSSSATSSSSQSPPHLGSGLFNPSSAGLSSFVHPGNFIGPALPGNHPGIGFSGRTSPHLGSGLATPMDAETASALRLAYVLRYTARPDYLRPYNEPGFYGPSLEPRNQNVGFGGQPSRQAPPYNQRATYVPQPQTQFIGFGNGSSTQPAGNEEPAAYGSQSMQRGRSASATGYLRSSSSSGGRQQRPTTPAPPTERSGSAASCDAQRARFEMRRTYWPDSPGRADLVAKVEHAENMTAISSLRADVRRQQLHLKDLAFLQREKKRIEEESQRLKQEEERLQQQDEIQWHQLERRSVKRAHRN